jgi:hypothetical protein
MLSCLGCLALALLVLAPSAWAESPAACEFQATARFTPGLTLTGGLSGTPTARPFFYSFSGQLGECRTESGGVLPSATIEAGQTKVEHVKNATTGLEDEVTYQEHVATGFGGCATSETSQTTLASWADGTYTVLTYSTRGGPPLLGKVAESITLSAVNAQPGDPTTFTIRTNRFAPGGEVQGVLHIEPTEPTACSTSTGATSAGLRGEVGIGLPPGL